MVPVGRRGPEGRAGTIRPMILRRRRTPRHPELEQVEAARTALAGDAGATALLDEVERSLGVALDDRDRIRSSLDELDLDSATRELKAALHARVSVTEPDTPAIAALRQRYDTIHVLRRRVGAVEEHIQKTLIDLDTLRANVAAMPSYGAGASSDLSARLADDAAALRAAHEEIEGIGGLR